MSKQVQKPPLAKEVVLGCTSTKYEYVVLRDVPDSPAFVVIPSNRYMSEIEFANMESGREQAFTVFMDHDGVW